MDEFRRLLRRARPFHGLFLGGLGCAIVAASFHPITTRVGEAVLEHLERARTLHEQGVLGQRLALFCLALPLLALINGAATYGASYLVARAAQGVLRDLRADLYRNLVHRPVGSLSQVTTGELVSRVTNDVQRLETGLSLRLTDIFVHVPAAVFLAVYLVVVNWRLALISLVVLPPVALLVRRWAIRLKRASRQAQEHTGSLASVLNETLGAIRVVKAYGAEPREIARFDGVNEDLRRVTLRSFRTMAASSPIMELLGAIVLAALVGVAAWQIVERNLDAPEAGAFVLGMTLLYRSMKKATTANNELQNTAAAARRCFELLDEDPATAREPGGAREITGLEEGIAFRDVWFHHGDTPVVRGFDLSVQRGEIIALVGESGAGKTTLTNLLVRFHDPTAGQITWDGIDLREIPPRSLRAQVALVTQDTVVFHDTVTRNIAYGDPNPDPDRVEAAARAAHAHEFIESMADGYDTILGEGGSRLSGGQRQRIAIARALHADRPVLILDEATSALDAQSEALVQEALSRLVEGRTVFIVAHRLATVRAADRIVVMAEGRITEVGSHDDLVRRDGTYRDLHRLQSGRG